MLTIGRHKLSSQVLLAPMAGISDAPFRSVCQSLGAGLTTSEMVTAQTGLWQSRKSSLRLSELDDVVSDHRHNGQTSAPPRSIQIAGSEPQAMAEAARQCVAKGAEIVDINMGCPAKKVCNKAAGSALLRDEQLVADILTSVVNAVAVPVTLKIRTGWCPASRNGTRIASIAEQCGIAALTVHGRTRACRFGGEAEYETIAAIVKTVAIPVIANGDIDSPAKAESVLKATGANAVMIGRAVQGQPWLIRQIDQHLRGGSVFHPHLLDIEKIVTAHLDALYNFYGETMGARIARKHLKWYSQRLVERANTQHRVRANCVSLLSAARLNRSPTRSDNTTKTLVQQLLSAVNTLESPVKQQACVRELFERLITKEEIAA